MIGLVSFYSVMAVVTAFLLLFFASFLFSLREGRIVSHRLLALFLIALAVSYMDSVFMYFGSFFAQYAPQVFYVGMSFELLVGPALLLFIWSKTQSEFALRPAHALHALPFVVHLLYMTVAYHMYTADEQRALLQDGAVLSHEEITVMTVLIHLHFCVYAVAALRALVTYRHRLEENVSSMRRLSLAWLRVLTVGLFLIWTLRFLNSMLWMQAPEWAMEHDVEVRPLITLGVFAFACAIVFKALRQPKTVHFQERPKYGSARMARDERAAYAERLVRHMEQERPYLDPLLDLAALAEAVALPPHDVSQVLNGHLNQNFYDFVNAYRVEECQRLLSDPGHSGRRIIEVMYAAGFNSKSVFNTVFKKQTGMTPSQYRKEAAREHQLVEG